MGLSSISNWVNDLHEAIEIGSRIGQKVILISTSTGGTLSAISALKDYLSNTILGYIFISPNFGINHKLAHLISWPYPEYRLHLFIGKTMQYINAPSWILNISSGVVYPEFILGSNLNSILSG